MRPTNGYYSVVQYCPDASRMEVANVGVLLFCPDIPWIDIRISPGNDRARKFFGRHSFDAHRLNAAKHSIENRIVLGKEKFQTLDDLCQFIETRANEIILTAPRPIKVDQPASVIDQLFAELVGGRRRAQVTQPDVPELDRFLRLPRFEKHVTFDATVKVPLLDKALRIPYVFRNGISTLIKPQTIPPDEDRAMAPAMRLAIEGDLLQRHPDEQGHKRQMVIIPLPEKGTTSDSIVRKQRDLFHAYGIEVVQRERLGEFEQRIQKQLH